MIKKYRFILFMAFFLIGGCSSGEDNSSKEHFLKDQVQVLEKAKGVEQMLKSADDKRRQAIEEQSR